MSLLFQKIRNWNNSSILFKCTCDDGVAATEESLQKLSTLTFDSAMSSRHIAMTLVDKLTKKSSSLSAKVIPVLCYLLRDSAVTFKLEIYNKLPVVKGLRDSSTECQGTAVAALYKELVELIESEYKKSLLSDHESNLASRRVSLSDVPIKTKGDITRELPIEAVISPEKRLVDLITAPSCIEPLPPMTEIWRFAGQYKQLNQHAINSELLQVLQNKDSMRQIRALAVIEYLSQHYQNSCKAAFLRTLQQISQSHNMDLQKKAQKILLKLSSDDYEITPCPLPPSESPRIGAQTQSTSRDNLYASHMKRSYDKIVNASVGYTSITESSHDEALLDLGSPCSSTSYNESPPPPSRFLALFNTNTATSRALSRRDSAGSTDNLLAVPGGTAV